MKTAVIALFLLAVFSLQAEIKILHGKVLSSSKMPIENVTVRKYPNEERVKTDTAGLFSINYDDAKFNVLIFTHPDFYSQKVGIYKLGDEFQIFTLDTLEYSEDGEVLKRYDRSNDTIVYQIHDKIDSKINHFSFNLLADYTNVRFNLFSELDPFLINRLNSTDYAFLMGFGIYANNYFFEFGYATFSNEKGEGDKDYLRDIKAQASMSKALLSFGYGFRFNSINTLITPSLSFHINTYNISTYKYDEFPVDEYLETKFIDIDFFQVFLSPKLNADIKIYSEKELYFLYLNAACGYIFKLHSEPVITSGFNDLSSPGRIIIDNIYLSAGFKFAINTDP